jgi:SAM-dependent methyltransferase
MDSPRVEHGFTSVDRQPVPSVWVSCLNRLSDEPFYRDYKRRVADLLEARPGGRYLDVGAGTGTDARDLAASARCSVTALDRSHTMASACRAIGVSAVVGDAGRLPFGDQCFNGCWADRAFQHLPEPRLALQDMLRVVQPGGRLVVVDPDYDTQVMELPDQELARRVLRFRADCLLRHGTIAHRMPAMFADAGMVDIRVDPMTLVVRDASAVDNVMGLRSWARAACDRGVLSAEDVRRWEQSYDHTVNSGRFLYAVTFFITSGTKAPQAVLCGAGFHAANAG